MAIENRIELTPVEMTPDIMALLEERGLIMRLRPQGPSKPHPLPLGGSYPLYVSNVANGPHQLIFVDVRHQNPEGSFGSHDDNEEFLLIGSNTSRRMYLIVSWLSFDELEAKLATGTAVSDDFCALIVRYNDPEVSFFTMLAGVPHGEILSQDTSGSPATFYVTEPSAMKTRYTTWNRTLLVLP